jgi:hypothetical protein
LKKLLAMSADFIYPNREALSHPQTVLPGSRIGLIDDSQFFATALDLPEPAGKFCPANRNDWRGHLF